MKCPVCKEPVEGSRSKKEVCFTCGLRIWKQCNSLFGFVAHATIDQVELLKKKKSKS
jgi:transcriptional regulator NrdR family protein